MATICERGEGKIYKLSGGVKNINIRRKNTKIGWLCQTFDALLIFTKNEDVGAAAPEIVRCSTSIIYRCHVYTSNGNMAVSVKLGLDV